MLRYPRTVRIMQTEIDALVQAHIQLARDTVHSAYRRLPQYIDCDELISAGYLTLVKAARTFDPARGVPFAAYLIPKIRWCVLDELRRLDWLTRPNRDKAKASGIEPPHPISLDSLLASRGETWSDCYLASTDDPPDAGIDVAAEQRLAVDAVALLPERLRYVLVELALGERTQCDLAAELGISASRVSQLHKQAATQARETIGGWMKIA